ncbi:MAG: hypothetical protein ABW067_01670 [Rhizobacter sp.]
MLELYPGFADGLRAVGNAHPLMVGVPAAGLVLWSLARWADDTSPRAVRRCAGVAVVLLGLGLLLRLGLALNEPRPMLAWWQWGIGLLVLPLFIRSARLGGVAAMLFFLCLAAALATGVGWVGDVRLATGAALWVGVVALAAALVLKRVIPAPPAPPPVEPRVLQQRLDTDDAREGADKYTRE